MSKTKVLYEKDPTKNKKYYVKQMSYKCLKISTKKFTKTQKEKIKTNNDDEKLRE